MGHSGVLPVLHATRRLPLLRRDRRAGLLGRWQAPLDLQLPNLSGQLGQATELKGDRVDLRDELGHGVSGGAVERPLGRSSSRNRSGGSVGIDEIAYRRDHKYLTLVCQIDPNCRRLLYVGKDRTEQSLGGFFETIPDSVLTGQKFIYLHGHVA